MTAGTRKRPPAPPGKDPSGGLTAAGRAAFAAKDGSHLKPGVTKSDAEMTPEDMKRKGSWAVRFYGRASLPPLVDARGEPTRFALSAHAWGEPVPTTEAEARRLAEKGRELLERYRAARAARLPATKRVATQQVSKTPATTKRAAKKQMAVKEGARKPVAKKQVGTKPVANTHQASRRHAPTPSSTTTAAAGKSASARLRKSEPGRD